jgi:Family of unknown function (DUF6876)
MMVSPQHAVRLTGEALGGLSMTRDSGSPARTRSPPKIALIQPYGKRVAVEEFQVWTLRVGADNTASLKCDDGNGNVVYSKDIGFTDFPLDEVKLWFANEVIYLPSEH